MSDKKKILIEAFNVYIQKEDSQKIERLMDPTFCLNLYRNSVNQSYRNEKNEVLTVFKEINLPLTKEQITSTLCDTKNNVCRYYKKEEDIFDFQGKKYLLTNNLYPGPGSDLDNVITYISPVIEEPLLSQLRSLVSGSEIKKQNQGESYEMTKNTEFKTEEAISFSLETFPTNSPFAERYVKALLAKPFVILAGNSGTGKTRIAKNFASWLEKKPTNSNSSSNKLIVPVGADWTDNTKVLGFFNPIKNTYESTKILDFIIDANNNTTIPFFLILDEMNLSHVERYFADFLSAMESNEPILLYKKNSDCNCLVPETIKIPDNLFITGTVNIDETTYMFSPKVLDRANVIEFKPTKNEILRTDARDPETNNLKVAPAGMAEGFVNLARNVKKIKKGWPTEISATIDDILGKLYDELEKYGFEFAFRTVKEIHRYISASYEFNEDGDIRYFMDEQIVQKILPKLHGNRRQLGKLLDSLISICKEDFYTPDITDELDNPRFYKYAETEDERKVYYLGLSLNKISQMKQKLETSQFASFI